MFKKQISIALFHCGFIYSGGGERIVLEEAKELKRRGYKVEIWAPTLDISKCYPKDVTELRVKTFLPQLPRFVPFRYAIMMIVTAFLAPLFAFKFINVDIFVGENQPGAWLAFCIAKILRKPYVVYMNQPNRLLYPRKIDREVKWQNLKGYETIRMVVHHFRPLTEWLDNISFTHGSAMLLNGAYIGKTIEQIYRKKGVLCSAGTRIIPKNLLPSKEQAFSGSFNLINTIGKKFIIKKPYILLTNRHVPQKKFAFAIQAMKKVVKNKPNASLVIPGAFTSHTRELKDLSSKLGLSENVLFLNQITEQNLQKLYKNAAIYVYTAPDEDFGMGIIEAMGAGVPVIAWNFAGPTVTVVNGKTGYLAKPYDIKDFERKMLAILSDSNLYLDFSKNAWKRASKYFSWKHHTDILEKEILRSLK